MVIIVTLHIDAELLSINTQYPLETEVDVLAALLADKRSENTKRAYAKDLQDFFLITLEQPPTPALLSQFLQLGRYDAISGCIAVQSNVNRAGVGGVYCKPETGSD